MQHQLAKFIQERTYLSSFLLHTILFGLVYSIFRPFYQTNDDVMMSLIVRGISVVTEPSEYILFMNVLIGKLLKALFSFYPSFDWYSAFMVACLFLGFVALGATIIKASNIVQSIIVYLVAFISFGLPALVKLQFTVVASILAISGYFTILKSLSSWERIFGAFICLLSALIRHESFLLITVLSFPVFIFELYYQKKRSILGYYFFLVILSFAFSYYSGNFYDQQNKGYTFNQYRAALAEFTFDERISAEQKEQLFRQANWSENDYLMLKHWIFMNDTIYNIAVFKQLLSNAPYTTYILKNLINYKSYFFLYDIAFSPASLIAFIITIILIVITGNNLKTMYFYLLMWGITFGLFVFIRYYMKAPPDRVLLPVFAFLGMLPLLIIRTGGNQISIVSRRNYLILLLVLPFLFNLYRTIYMTFEDSQNVVHNNSFLKDFISENHLNQASNLIVPVGVGFPLEFILPFENLQYMRGIDLFPLGCLQISIQQKQILEKHNIKDFYLSLVTQPNIYVLLYEPSQDLDLIIKYFQEHYFLNISHEVVATWGQRKLIKLLH